MKNRRLVLVLILGLAVALFVSACGVVVGPVGFTNGGPAILSPGLTGLHLPGLTSAHPRAVMGSMAHAARATQTVRAQSLYEHGLGGCDGVH